MTRPSLWPRLSAIPSGWRAPSAQLARRKRRSEGLKRFIGQAGTDGGRRAGAVVEQEAEERQWVSSAVERAATERLAAVVEAASAVLHYQANRDALVQLIERSDSGDDFSLLPILPRSSFRGRLADFLQPSAGSVTVASTSGTGGESTPVVKPRSSVTERGALERRWYAALGLPDSFTIANVTPWSGRGFVIDGFHGQPVRFANVGASDVVDAFVRDRPVGSLLLAAPDVLEYILTATPPCGVTAAATSYDVLSEDRHARLALCGVALAELYAASELCAPIAFGFPECAGMHVNADYVLVEVVAEDGRRAHFGEAGDVVVTDLLNTAMPLIRYAIGDVGVLYPPDSCGCGRALPLISLRGRALDDVATPAGHAAARVVCDAVASTIGGPFYIDQIGAATFEVVAVADTDVGAVRAALAGLLGECAVLTARPDGRRRALIREGGRVVVTAAREPLEVNLGRPAPPRWRDHPATELRRPHRSA